MGLSKYLNSTYRPSYNQSPLDGLIEVTRLLTSVIIPVPMSLPVNHYLGPGVTNPKLTRKKKVQQTTNMEPYIDGLGFRVITV